MVDNSILKQSGGILNRFEFFTTPDFNLPTKQVIIPISNIAPERGKIGRKKAPITEYVLIGFDTEYQTFAPVTSDEVKAGQAKNEVLSYQFDIKVITQDLDDNRQVHCSGIVIPQENERILLNQFIVAALGTLVTEHPTVSIPTDVYLVGHFTRADLPAFSDFKDTAEKSMSNIRNTFVSLDRSIKLDLVDTDSRSIAQFNIRLRDTILLAPANAKSLSDVGDILGFSKIKLDEDRGRELSIKENMKEFRKSHWEKFREYAIRDAEVCTRYAERVIRKYFDLFNEFKMPLTLTSFGTLLVVDNWKKQGLDADLLLGKEHVKSRKFSKKLGYQKVTDEHPYLEQVHFESLFVTETYHGGRNEQFVFGICDEGTWRDHDLSSAYPTAMSIIGQPDWSQVKVLNDIDSVNFDDIAFFSVDFEFPSTIRFPTLPVRTENGIIFPRKGKSFCAAPEIFLAQKLGANLKLRRAVHVQSNKDEPVFQGFIKQCIDNRNQHKKGTFDNLFWKEVGNSTYGKTAQGLRQKRVYDLRDDDMVELPESELTQPFFASFITSFTRAVLGEILNAFTPSVTVFSVTTDGFLSNASDREIENATKGPLFKAFAAARKKLTDSDDALEVKHEIRQPVGWRTRGSATLKPGPKQGSNIVLQKGGIKTNQHFDLDEENDHLVNLFLNRQPDQKLEYTVGLGVKDMVRFEGDFVSRSISKRLSMEFDWKRRPREPMEKAATYKGQQVSHLSFETEPHEDIRSFQKYRDTWESYNKKNRQLLKSVPDFKRFHNYFLLKEIAGGDPSKYLKRNESADLSRLRRDLTRAFKHQKAGFDLILGHGKIRDSEFAATLTEYGIPCKKEDVENGKKKDFTPYQTMKTERVLQCLGKLKSERFPELEIDEFLTQ